MLTALIVALSAVVIGILGYLIWIAFFDTSFMVEDDCDVDEWDDNV